jgi:predicted ATPase/DNA-binding SARP family transcriptional activator
MFGPLRVRVAGQMADFRTDAERALLAYLAACQGVAQRRDSLAGLLSPDRSDIEALTYLRNRLTRLREQIGDDKADPPWLELDRKQIGLRSSERIVVDLSQFDQHLATVEAHAHRQLAGCPSCLDALQRAVQLVRGEVLAGLNFPSEPWQTWLAAQREHYQLRALDALTQLREAHAARGDWAAVLELAQRQLGFEPWLEPAHRAIMTAHYQLGDRNAALAHYGQCERILWEELGVEPEPETQELRQQIFEDDLEPMGGQAVPDNLPLQIGQFFGRQVERQQLLQRLVSPNYRFVTFVGWGGVGKTRLAIEIGQQLKASFPDGVWFVSLDSASGDAEQIKVSIGEALGLEQRGKQLTGEQVLAILRDKQLLLILDNCEAALDQLGFLALWLKRAPQLTILATSREPLNFQHESLLLLGALATGESEIGDAEALFAERGQMAWDGFALSDENLGQVRQICELVDGSPLGIALAAAWVRRRSLQQIQREISSSLDFLSTRLRDIDPRHRSMRAVFETSWQLLERHEQSVLAALAVFPASFSLEAAAAVAGASQDDLDQLCEKSLLQQQHQPERYQLHSLLRQFAAAKLGEARPRLERRFIGYFLAFAKRHQHEPRRLQPEWRNLSAALSAAHQLADWASVLELAQRLDQAWFRQMRFSEMREGLRCVLDAAEALHDRAALGFALLRLGEIETELGDYRAAEGLLSDALGHFMQLEDGSRIAQTRFLLGRIKDEQAQDEQALELFEESRRIFEAERDWLGVAKNLNMIAVYQVKKKRDLPSAQAILEQSLALQQDSPPTPSYIETLRNLARVSSWSDATAQAERYLFEAARLSKQLDDEGEHAAVLYEHALLCRRLGQHDQALSLGYQALDSFKKVGGLRWQALITTQLGLVHQAKHEYDQGLAQFQTGLAIFRDLGDLYEQAYSYYYLHKLYAELGQEEQSLHAKQHATNLSREVNDLRLLERLNKS